MSWVFTPPPVESLWARWAPRFLAAGVDPIVLDELRSQITTWEEWCPAFRRIAEQTEEWAGKALDQGHRLTAGELFTRASTLYHYGGMVNMSDMDEFEEMAARKVASYARGGPLLAVPTQSVAVEVDGVRLPGYLRVPASDAPPPVVIMLPGWEGCKEEAGMSVGGLLDRGLAVLTFDGPGIGETLPRLPLTGEYGPSVSQLIDMLEGRDDVDAGRVGLQGTSRGGLLAVKATAFDHRVAALAAVGPGYETRMIHWGAGMEELAQVYVQYLFHQDSPEALEQRLTGSDLGLEGSGERVVCPTLVVTDDQESESQYGGSMRLFEELTGPKELAIFSGAQRNGLRRVYLVRPMVADWLADQLLGS